MKKIFLENNHKLSIFIILILSLLLFYRSVIGEGQLLYVDMLFPNSIDRIIEFATYMWFPYSSFSIGQVMMKLPWLLFFAPMAIFDTNSSNYILLLFIFTFFMAGLSSYLLTYYTIVTFLHGNKNRFLVSFASCVTSFIYMYNPLSLGFLWAYGFYPTYSLFPLILLLVIISINKTTKLYLLATGLIMTLASTSVHGVIWINILLITSFIFFTSIDSSSQKILNNLKKIIIILGSYLLFSSFWILPSSIIAINGDVQPPYTFSEQMLNRLSNSSSIIDSIRLSSGTRFFISPEFIGLNISKEKVPEIASSLSHRSFTNPSSVQDKFWIISSFFIPIFAFGSIFLYKNSYLKKIIIFFTLLSIISIFLSIGTNSPVPYIYKWLAIDAPWSNTFGWLFRAPYRFQVLSSVGLSVMCGYSIFKISEISPNNRVTFACGSLLIISFLIGTFYFIEPIADAHANYIFGPTKIPDEYDIINNWLKNQSGDFKVFYLPKFPENGYFPSWAPEKRIGPVSIVSSSKESFINFFNPPTTKFINWLDLSMHNNLDIHGRLILNNTVYIDNSAYNLDIGKIVAPLGIKYVILDESMKNSIGVRNTLNNSSDLRLIFNKNFLYIYENLNYVPERIDIKKKVITIENMDQYILLNEMITNLSSDIALINNNVINTYSDGVSIDNFLVNLINNPSFEKSRNKYSGYPIGWSDAYNNSNFKINLDDNIYKSGKYSVRIETDKSKFIGWIKGNNISVIPGEWLMTRSNIKFSNAESAHFVIYGYDKKSKIWRQIIHSPSIQSGTSDWKEYTSVFRIPENINKIQPYLAAGYLERNRKNKATTWFDDMAIYKLDINKIYTYADSGSVDIYTKGNIEKREGILKSGIEPATISNYKKINPTLYKVKVNASKPFMISFAESYDPLWKLKIDKINGKSADSEKIRSVPLYSVINGFWINQTGDIDITIEYEPQKWFYLGAVISITSLFICAGYLVHDWRKRKSKQK